MESGSRSRTLSTLLLLSFVSACPAESSVVIQYTSALYATFSTYTANGLSVGLDIWLIDLLAVWLVIRLCVMHTDRLFIGLTGLLSILLLTDRLVKLLSELLAVLLIAVRLNYRQLGRLADELMTAYRAECRAFIYRTSALRAMVLGRCLIRAGFRWVVWRALRLAFSFEDLLTVYKQYDPYNDEQQGRAG